MIYLVCWGICVFCMFAYMVCSRLDKIHGELLIMNRQITYYGESDMKYRIHGEY